MYQSGESESLATLLPTIPMLHICNQHSLVGAHSSIEQNLFCCASFPRQAYQLHIHQRRGGLGS